MDHAAHPDLATPPRYRRALDRCRSIASKGRNNLQQAAQLLGDGPRYRFFLSAYAAMRVLDDAVDERFLGLDPMERVSRRPVLLEQVERWRAQVTDAARGRFADNHGSFEPLVFEALARHLGRSDLGTGPFDRLAESLAADIRETSLQSWDDFLHYAEGACVAPGSVFIYLLACDCDSDGRTRIELPEPTRDYARDMALFCYLVHILRDLPTDARRDPQLLTIPRELLAQFDLNAQGLQKAVTENDRARLEPLLAVLRGEADHYELRAEERMASLAPHLPRRHLEILSYLFQLYRNSYRQLCLAADAAGS